MIKILILFLLPYYIFAADKIYPCPAKEKTLYEILSQEDDKHVFLNHKPEKDLLNSKKNRELLSDVYSGVMTNNGDSYVMMGVNVTVDGKETKAYYLVKLNAALLISSKQSPFYEIKGTFLGFSDNEEFLKKELSFLPFKTVKTKTKQELSVSLLRLKAEKTIFKDDKTGVSVDAFAAADLLGYTVQEYINQNGKVEKLNLADVKIGFRVRKDKDLELSVYAGKSLGYTFSEYEGVIPRVTSTTYGAQLDIHHTERFKTTFLYEKRKINTPHGTVDDDTIKLSLQFKFRGFEYIYDDIRLMFRRMR